MVKIGGKSLDVEQVQAPGELAESIDERCVAQLKAGEIGEDRGSLRSHTLWNVGLLSMCFGMGWAMLFVQVGTTTVAAKQWASTAFGTVPYGFLAGSHALSALPAQTLMRRCGARPWYVFGGIMGAIGNGICILAAIYQSPVLLCIASPFCGIANAYANFLRFEPTRFVSPEHIPLAVSSVVAGGVLGGGMGPIISRFSRTMLKHEFEGTYVVSVCVWLLESLLVSLIGFRRPSQRRGVRSEEEPASCIAENRHSKETSVLVATPAPQADAAPLSIAHPPSPSCEPAPRPLLEILQQPSYLVAVISGTISYTSMATIMLAALLAMKVVQPGSHKVDLDAKAGVYTFDDVQNVILVHVEAMFVPSFFTGFIIGHIGPALANAIGFAILLVGIFLFLAGTQLWLFFCTLTLVGLGWNLAFVASTTLVATCHTPSEKDKVQGFNDLCVFGVNTVITATSSLVLQALVNWHAFVLLYGGLTTPGFLLALLFFLSKRSQTG